jgi:hypothetical protein
MFAERFLGLFSSHPSYYSWIFNVPIFPELFQEHIYWRRRKLFLIRKEKRCVVDWPVVGGIITPKQQSGKIKCFNSKKIHQQTFFFEN